MKICTLNSRGPQDEGIQDFPYRLPLIVEFMRAEAPDVFGLQEVRADQYEALRAALPEYEFFGTGRMSQRSNEAVPLAWRKDSFFALSADQFWLSETPDVPASRAGNAYYPRICTHAVLVSKEDFTKKLSVYNVHLDHECPIAQALGGELVLSRMQAEDPDIPKLLFGDLNVEPDSPVIQKLLAGGLVDLSDELSGTYQGFGQDEPKKIDYIFAGGPLRTQGKARMTKYQNAAGTMISDHWPLCQDFEL